MRTSYISCSIESIADRSRSESVAEVPVDAGSECTRLPASVLDRVGVRREKKDLTFVMANGQHVTRSVGFAVIRSGEFFTVDEVVLGEAGDLSLLGTRSLEGFNARVDSQMKRLVAAGPLPAATCGVRARVR